MRQLVYFMALTLVGLAFTVPISNEDDTNDIKVLVTEEFFDDKLIVYTSDHDVVKLLSPSNTLKFEVVSGDEAVNLQTVLFFVLADTKGEQIEYKGLFVRKDGVVTKLLDNGRDAAVSSDSRKVYFGATDGLYSYNEKENTAEKYGTITDSIISIGKVSGSDILYILTEDHVLYKVTEEGTKKEKVEEVVNAQKIVLDDENNLYYYTKDKHVYVLVPDGVKQIEGLPIDESSDIDILNPPFLMENSIPVIIDNTAYIVSWNGNSEIGGLKLEVKPTAYSMEAILLQYFAYNKNIYEYNVLALLYDELSYDLRSLSENRSDFIEQISSRARGDENIY